MPRAYSADMRSRVIAGVEGGASRREAEQYDISASMAVIWVRCFRETGCCAAKQRGGGWLSRITNYGQKWGLSLYFSGSYVSPSPPKSGGIRVYWVGKSGVNTVCATTARSSRAR